MNEPNQFDSRCYIKCDICGVHFNILHYRGFCPHPPVKESGEDMRMDNKKEITIDKSRTVGNLPNYIAIGHRHFEKEQADPSVGNGTVTYILPVDLAAVTLPANLMDDIDSIEMTYRQKGLIK